MKDLTGEKEMLFEYIECAKNMANDPKTLSSRRVFSTDLAHDLEEEWGQVNTEHLDLWSQASNLGRFEYRKLDNDGGTKRIEEWLHRGADLTRKYGNEVLEKYGYLLPLDFQVNELATFEFEWLDLDGRTTILEYDIRKGDDVLEGCGEEVLRKYGHLRALLPTAPNAEAGPVERPRGKSRTTKS